ncbi:MULTISPECIES: GDSL-type esterase/lipase family protein [Asticcacaulis]|uniref:GDSL-type esterase/lipase family protein n=1 Tax=Asticcacaulis TaxID=76890 RepID=UPI001AE3ADA2|nr:MULTISPECIES: GDSL-type esterase/lipase family protein [Asticcacaulis]MBP2161370.1 lysophospholipase L1-like esterase [Asticcacaulis solisilvae]MDR6802415.1 lysophospholipase L1-like esterase [Asticcacaulis sp. BE141]
MDTKRRGLLAGVVAGAAGLMAAKGAVAQNLPPVPPLPAIKGEDVGIETIKAALRRASDKSLGFEPIGEDWPNLLRYRQDNARVKALPPSARRAVFMGDSITDNWPGQAKAFFDGNGFVGRGISGQVSAQMVVRFGPEVVDLKPRVVHILAGTNDIAENRDPYDFDQTTRNLAAMGSIAKANGIRVVMGSVPPATSFAWKPQRGNRVAEIKALNTWIHKHCQAHGFVYADYWPVLAMPDGALKPQLGNDNVHPNAAGYAVMSPIALAAIEAALKT